MQYNDIKCITARTINLKPLHNKYRTMFEINNRWGAEGIVSSRVVVCEMRASIKLYKSMALKGHMGC